MSDVQARGAEVLAEHMPLGFRCECGWDSHQSATYATEHAAHVAAVLAGADLLVELDREQCEHADDLVGALEELDAARAELAEVKAERDVYRNRPQQEACDRRVREAERRGAVAALRDMAEKFRQAKRHGYLFLRDTSTRVPWDDVAQYLDQHADRIEGEDRG